MIQLFQHTIDQVLEFIDIVEDDSSDVPLVESEPISYEMPISVMEITEDLIAEEPIIIE